MIASASPADLQREPAYEIVTYRIPDDPAASTIAVTIWCSVCQTPIYTGVPKDPNDPPRTWLSDHLAQHNDPIRALDVTVEWQLVATCSVCPDGTGDMQVDDEGFIICNTCRTLWCADGTQGRLEGNY